MPLSRPDDPRDPRPVYVQIMEQLRRRILSGQIRDRLTSEIELAQQLGTSRGTVQQAISGLVQEGLLHRHRGLGTFVDLDRVESYYREISSFTGAMKSQGLKPSVQLLRFSREVPPADVAATLQLEPGQDVFFYSRVVRIDGVPIVLTVSYIPAWRFPGLQISAPDESLYKILRQEFGATPFRAKDSYTPEAAAGETAAALDLAEGTPIFRVERAAYDHSGGAIEFAISWFNRGKVTVEILPTSLFVEEQLYAGKAAGSQWHHHFTTEYRTEG